MLITNSRNYDLIDWEIERTNLVLRKKFKELRKPLLEEAKALTQGNIPTSVTKPLRPFAVNKSNFVTSFQGYKGKVQKIRLSASSSFPLLPINKQKGKLSRGFRTKLKTQGDTEYVELYNTSRQGKFILDDRGTQKMIGRGFQKRLRDRMRKYRVNEN